jgi:hypothetical protein
MTKSDTPAGKNFLRILEVGNQPLFAIAVPEQTEFYWTGVKPRDKAKISLGPRALLRCLKKLRRGDFDLLVVHATQYAPWHPRSFLTILRDWHFRAPLGLFANFAWRFIHLFHSVPIAVIDLDDSFLVGRHNDFLLRACRAFFKRELPSDHWLAFAGRIYPNFPGRRWRSKASSVAMMRKLRPISYGIPVHTLDPLLLPKDSSPPEKTTDIFFAGALHGNSTVRETGFLELRALEREGYVVDLPEARLTPPEFFKRLSAAWLAWSPGGLGWDCGRHYETALAGTVPLINTPTILRDKPLKDGEHCFLYNPEPGELAQAVRKALADRPRLRRMSDAAAAHVVRHHTPLARCERITSIVLGRRLDGSDANIAS